MCYLCDAIQLENKNFVARWEPFPVNIGHMKIMPRRHVTDISELTEKEWKDFYSLLNRVLKYLKTSLGDREPDGFNIGINLGKAAGQTLEHLHWHVIPRYYGDVEDPRGGVRNLKPAKIDW